MSARIKGSAGMIGLALGSGSARGWAHIGVVRALREAGIDIGCVAGTSIGSLVGAAVVLDQMDPLEEFARQLSWKQIVSFLDVVLPRSGLIDGGTITDFFRRHVRDTTIESLPLPYHAVATDLSTGREALLGDGDLIDAIRASISVPGIFTPVKRGDTFLADGGMVNPVPVSVARKLGADFVIAVDLNHDVLDQRDAARCRKVEPSRAEPTSVLKWDLTRVWTQRVREFGSPAFAQMRQWMRRDPTPNIFEVLTTSINIMEAQITTIQLAANPPDLLIQPRLGHIRFMEFYRADEAIAEGYRAAKAQLERYGAI